MKNKDDIPIPCPICGKRICGVEGKPEGDFAVKLKCHGSCGLVSLSAQYIRKILTKHIKKL